MEFSNVKSIKQNKKMETLAFRIKLNVEGFKKVLLKNNKKLNDSLIYKMLQNKKMLEKLTFQN
jgi:hypothetical protein